MKSLVLAAVAAAALVTSASATVVDMGAATCTDTKSWDANTAGGYLMWLDGYMSGKTGDTNLDTDGVAKLATAIDSYCASHPDDKILDVVNSAMEPSK